MSEKIQHLLDNFEKPSLDLVSLIKNYELSQDLPVFDKKSLLCNEFITNLIDYLDSVNGLEKKEVSQLICKRYSIIHYECLLNYCFNNIKKLLSELILIDLKKKIDINKYGLMDKYLPSNNNDTFFISSTHFDSIEKLLKFGFRFNEEKYSRSGETLMANILKARGGEITSIILPYLDEINPKVITLDYQSSLLENYKNSKFFNEVKSIYYKKLYEIIFIEKITVETKKTKI